jgi:TFIIH basal transcription factor complex TTD-A subunit
MVHAKKGVLITCDSAMKQFLMHLNRTHHFVLMDLDETHILVAPGERIRTLIENEIEALQKQNTYDRPADKRATK